MDPGWARDALTLLAGVSTGVLSGAFGVGGAVISTPAVRALGLSATLAVGTTLPSILPGALTGFVRYRRTDLIDWPAVRRTVPTGIFAAVGGAELAHVLPGAGHPLMIMTATLLLWSSVRLIRDTDHEPNAAQHQHHSLIAAGIGTLAGLLSGLLGIGGGVLMVPAFRQYLRMPIKRAVATSLICVGCFGLPGTVAHTLNHGIQWRFAILLTCAVIPGARLGSGLAMKASDHRLRTLFGVFVGVVAVVYLIFEITALVRV